MLSDDLARFLESGLSVLVGTRDARLLPEAVRCAGVEVGARGTEASVWIPDAAGVRALANLRENGQIAVCVSRPWDHRTIQLKGRVVELRPARAEERAAVDAYRAAFAAILAELGLPKRHSMRMDFWPCHRARFGVEAVFSQTPGPGAGERIAGASGTPAR